MKNNLYSVQFKGGFIKVVAFTSYQAQILAQAEAIKRGWDHEIIDWRII